MLSAVSSSACTSATVASNLSCSSHLRGTRVVCERIAWLLLHRLVLRIGQLACVLGHSPSDIVQ